MQSSRFYIYLPCLICSITSLAQKQPLSDSSYAFLESVGSPIISSDGTIVVYNIASQKSPAKLIIQSTNSAWKKEIINGQTPVITSDSRFVIYQVLPDTLFLFQPMLGVTETILNVSSFKISAKGEQWLAYTSNTNGDMLRLRNLSTRKETVFPFAKDYFFNPNGDALVINRCSKGELVPRNMLIWVSLPKMSTDTIFTGRADLRFLTFSTNGQELAFLQEREIDAKNIVEMQYYKLGMKRSVVKVESSTLSKKRGLNLAIDQPLFSDDGKKLYFTLVRDSRSIDSLSNNKDYANVDVWNYKDRYLQSQQLIDWKTGITGVNRRYTAVLTISTDSVIYLDSDEDEPNPILGNGGNSDYVLVTSKINTWEAHWRTFETSSAYVMSTADGSRRLVPKAIGVTSASFSSRAKYVIGFDNTTNCYFAYNIAKGSIKNISYNIPNRLYHYDYDRPSHAPAFGVAAWLEDDSAVLIYDRYDIWEIDPEGIKPPTNITNGYGKAHNIIFRYIFFNGTASKPPIIRSDEKILLSAFDPINKFNGFYAKKLSSKSDPQKLTMGPYIYYRPQIFLYTRAISFPPIKAADSNIFIISRMSPVQSPDLFSTKDFVNFVRLTNVQPQNKFNWMTAELVRWKISIHQFGEGILYKPENFNPNMKYPVIIHFYEKDANNLYQFISPSLSEGAIDIPYFVSNGYLVFDPNIYYKKGQPGKSICRSVLSAIKYIKQYKWVDPKKIGVQGISFGGYEVNYLITRTDIFAAAAETAGLCDMVSMYDQLRPGPGVSNQYYFETGQGRLGSTLWDKPKLYLDNSPIFRANKVVTPLLIMHNKDDDAVPWIQGVEWFTALRRLGKKVWLLQYDGEHHGLSQVKSKKDFTARLKQFFDYYLKGIQEPIWMSIGVSAEEKNRHINTGVD